ncbi:AfsR/SARP family transcriptional regulator [Amycolatopsis sp. OK19-0408]|uniref:AfsR/SARP family transcriptional regulator n=1 Tax=Amycolatopsis iheyensis TaxID=2945988 RepID=A0A9X2NFV1_9PSEU|nr:AfsR/SARP family transcriptional regulator [Amycolatopsis iheyensis]MCR6487904.1 AfsR/SARP family transcriptional regulator [Amycolatopsis iheyensis]
MTDATRYEVLGPVRAWRGDVEIELGPPQQRAALAALLLQGGTPLSPSQLVKALWGGAEPRAAVGMVRSYVSRLRHAGVPIESIGGGYALNSASLDLTDFERALASGSGLRAALRRWHGTPLSGINGFEPERARLEQLRLRARETLAAADIEAGSHVLAAAELADLITEQPLRERPRELRMLALYRSGRQAEALDVFTSIQRLLESERGLYPGPELREMQRRILTSDPTLLPAPRPSQLPPPLPEFVGRTAEMGALSAALKRTPVIGIEGLAAIGKTTLAVHLAHTLTFPDGQLFVDLSASTDPLSELLRGIGVTAPPTSPSERAALWRTHTTGRRLLVILDNARDAEEVRPLLPGTGSAVVITARQRLYGLSPAVWTRLGGLSVSESMTLLERLLGAARVHAEPAESWELATRTAGFPQVIQAIAARLASRPNWSMASALTRLGRPAPGAPVTPPECGAIERPYESALADLTPAQARAFVSLSLMSTITVETASEALDLATRDTTVLLESLVDAHLLEPAGQEGYRYEEPLRLFAQARAAESMQTA